MARAVLLWMDGGLHEYGSALRMNEGSSEHVDWELDVARTVGSEGRG